jgi:hypothetical protein
MAWSGVEVQRIAWLAAFWVAVLLYAPRRDRADSGVRFVVGLVLGASLAHVGWAMLHLPRVLEHPGALLDATGFSAAFVPLGLLFAAPWRAPPAARERWLAAALGALPLALSVARVGCVAAGCCHGVPTDLAWLRPRHPTVSYELVLLAALHVAVARVPERHVPAAVLAGLGAIRLAVEPWRAPPPLGEPVVSPALLGAAWIAAGGALARFRFVTGADRPPEARGGGRQRHRA